MSFFLTNANKFPIIKTIIRHKNVIRRKSDTTNSKFVPFLEMINQRRDEADRSVLVQVQSSQSFKELHSYCSSVGTVQGMFHYTVGLDPMNFIIVEFASPQDVQNIIKESSHTNDHHIVPVHSQFLWFKACNRKLPKLKHSRTAMLEIENGTRIIKEAEVLTMLRKCENVSEQMITLYNNTRLNDVGTRLRFLTAKQIETSLEGMFPHAQALPFGSSVNGYGKMGCDLDLVLRLTSEEKRKDETRLVFHCKASSGSERMMWQRNMETISDLIQLFLPGCSQVRRILQARVPIIKYCQQLTDVDCDLSMTNLSGVYMSDFLYIMGNIDPRIKPLIFTVRKWAAEVGITNPQPGRWLTNFSLTLMVLAFAQKPPHSPPILPTLNHLVKRAGPNDEYTTEDGINCTFLRDISQLNNSTANKESLESLLLEFFQFYAEFNYENKAICLNDTVNLTKPEHCAIYIVNPLDRGLNVSKNVSLEELERFRTEVRNAAWILESDTKNENWGVLSLCQHNRRMTNSRRIMEVCTLFSEESKENTSENTQVEYKNESVKRQVKQIKEETESKLANMKEKLVR